MYHLSETLNGAKSVDIAIVVGRRAKFFDLEGSVKLKFVLVALSVSGALFIGAVQGAFAQGSGAVSTTTTFHNVTETFADVQPCSGEPATITTTYNGAVHVTILTSGKGAGTFWFTITETGSFVIEVVGDPASPYTGHFAFWDGDNGNLRNSTETETLEIHGTGADGSVLNAHLVQHLTINADGTATALFVKLVCP